MKHFAIFLCMVVGFACVDLQRVEIGEDDSKAAKIACKAASLGANERITEDKAIGSKDVQTSAQTRDETSKETEASEKHASSAAMSTNVESERKKSGQRKQLRKPAKYDLGSILKHSHGNISTNSAIGENRSLPRTSFDGCNTSGPVTLALRIKWHYRRMKAEFSAEGKAELARRKRTNGGIEGLEGFNTYGIASLEVKGCFDVPRSTEPRLVYDIQNEICRDAQTLLVNIARDFWKEINNLSNIQTDYFHSGPGASKYLDVKLNELNLFTRPFTMEKYEHLFAEPAASQNEEKSMRVLFECRREERDTRFENDYSDMHEVVFVIFLCVVIGIFTLLVYTGGGLNDPFAKEYARRNVPRVEQI